MVITSGNEEDKGNQEKESKEESILAMLGIIGTILNLVVIIFVYIYTTLWTLAYKENRQNNRERWQQTWQVIDMLFNQNWLCTTLTHHKSTACGQQKLKHN